MTAVLCCAENCHNPLPSHPAPTVVCAACHRATERRLTELPSLYRRTETVLAGQRTPPRVRVSGGSPGGITIDDDVVSARAEVRSVLASWAGLVAGEHPGAGIRPARDVPELCAYLARHLDWLIAHTGAADLVSEIAELHRNVVHVVDPNGPEQRVLGTCRRAGCGMPVRARVPATGIGGVPAGCDAGHPAPPSDWLLISRAGSPA